jgi:hypothetical protein
VLCVVLRCFNDPQLLMLFFLCCGAVNTAVVAAEVMRGGSLQVACRVVLVVL